MLLFRSSAVTRTPALISPLTLPVRYWLTTLRGAENSEVSPVTSLVAVAVMAPLATFLNAKETLPSEPVVTIFSPKNFLTSLPEPQGEEEAKFPRLHAASCARPVSTEADYIPCERRFRTRNSGSGITKNAKAEVPAPVGEKAPTFGCTERRQLPFARGTATRYPHCFRQRDGGPWC